MINFGTSKHVLFIIFLQNFIKRDLLDGCITNALILAWFQP